MDSPETSLKELFPAPERLTPSPAASNSSTASATSTGFTLRIRFGGNIGFLPASQGRAMYAFLPSDDLFRQIDQRIPRHIPALLFSLSDVVGVPSLPMGSEGMWQLAHQHLDIVAPGLSAPPSLDIDGFDYTNNTLEVPALDFTTPYHFGWVSNVERACAGRGTRGAGVMDRVFLDLSLGQTLGDLLAARIPLTAGRIFVSDFLSDSQRGRLVCRYRPFGGRAATPDHQQFVASEVTVEIPIAGDSVEFRSKDLRDGTAGGILRLGPSQTSTVPPRLVEIAILNEEAENILGSGTGPGFLIDSPRDQDRIFESFAAFCPGANGLVGGSEVPVPVAASFVQPPPGRRPLRNSVPCSPYLLS